MKCFNCWAVVFSLIAFLGLTACNDKDDPIPLPTANPLELVGNWKVVSWTENGVANPSKVGEYWIISRKKIIVAEESPVAYAYNNHVMTIGGVGYAITFSGDNLVLTRVGEGAPLVVTFEEMEELPEPDEPVEPDEPFVSIPRADLIGVWAVTSWSTDGIDSPSNRGQLWIIGENTLQVGAKGTPAYYNYCSVCTNVFTYADRDYVVTFRGEGAEKELVFSLKSGDYPETITFTASELPNTYTALPQGANAYKDTCLTLEFGAVPTLGQSGKIKIFKADGTQVDLIDLADVADGHARMDNNTLLTTAMDMIGSAKLGRYRVVNYDPVTIDGKKVIIKPHYGVLEYGASYYVTVEQAAISADNFQGITNNEDWTFTVKSAPGMKAEVTVGSSSNADFRTVQAALDYAYDCGKDAAVTINVRNGIYEEQLFMRYNNNVTIKGESREGTIIRYDNCDLYASGVGGSVSAKPALGASITYSGGRGVMLIESSDMVRFENLTMQNTHGSGSQAEVLYNNDNSGNCRVVFVNCNILSAQDTLNLKGYTWFYNCLIAGDVDFIWGGVDTSLFENCEIRAVNGGYTVQARCAVGKKGFVFLNCSLTKAAGANGDPTYLGRTGGTSTWDNVSYINCRMGAHVAPAGWSGVMSPAVADAVNGWKEYNSQDASGAKLDVSKRLAGTYQLTEAEYQAGFKDRLMIFAACAKGTAWLTE